MSDILERFPETGKFGTASQSWNPCLAVASFRLHPTDMNAMGGPELVLILAALAVIGLGMAGVAFAVYVIVRAAGKSRPIPMAPPLPPVDSEAPHPVAESNEVRH